MEQSDSIGSLAKALCIVQSQLEGARKDSKNTFLKSSYADLSSVWDACRDLLHKNELAVVQTSSVIEGRDLVVVTTLMHSSGEWIRGQLAVPLTKQDPQGIGSAFTYARRYALSAIVGISPEDDDAESTTLRNKPDTAKKPSQEPPKPAQEATKRTTGAIESQSNSNPQGKTYDAKDLGAKLTRLSEEAPKIWEIENVKRTLAIVGGKGDTVSELVKSLKPQPLKEFLESVDLAIKNLDPEDKHN